MHSRLLFLAALALAPQCIWAVSDEQADENLIYFVMAQQAAIHCATQNEHTRTAVEVWRSRHRQVLGESIAAVQAQARRKGLNLAEQDLLVIERRAATESKVRTAIKQKGVPCEDFQTWLGVLSSKIQP